MTTMDQYGMTWVENFYQKVEAMCLEVEENMYQDTVKYVENQVQTVGATVKKFYSDVLEDLSHAPTDPVKAHTLGGDINLSHLDVTQKLAPSTIDPIKVMASNFSLKEHADIRIYKKPIVDVKEEIIKAETDLPAPVLHIIPHEVKDLGESLSVNGVRGLNNPSLSSIDSVRRGSPDFNFRKLNDSDILKQSKVSDNFIEVGPPPSVAAGIADPLRKNLEPIQCDSEEENICCGITSANECFVDGSVAFPSTDKICSVESSGKEGMETRLLFSGCTLEESSGTAMNEDMVYVTTTSVDITQHTECIGEVSSSNTGNSEDRNIDDAVHEPRMATVEASNGEIELEETCVMVDTRNSSCFVSPKHKSYKKKIRDAFATKMKSARKQEYEQLAMRRGEEVDTGSFNRQVVGTSIQTLVGAQRQNSQAHDLSESEWELV